MHMSSVISTSSIPESVSQLTSRNEEMVNSPENVFAARAMLPNNQCRVSCPAAKQTCEKAALLRMPVVFHIVWALHLAYASHMRIPHRRPASRVLSRVRQVLRPEHLGTVQQRIGCIVPPDVVPVLDTWDRRVSIVSVAGSVARGWCIGVRMRRNSRRLPHLLADTSARGGYRLDAHITAACRVSWAVAFASLRTPAALDMCRRRCKNEGSRWCDTVCKSCPWSTRFTRTGSMWGIGCSMCLCEYR